MGETKIKKRTMKVSAVQETTEGTAVAETDAGALFPFGDGFIINVDRESIPNDGVTGSLTETKPQAGMWADSLGGTYHSRLRGKGSLSSPDWHLLMKSLLGLEVANTDGVVDAASTTSSIVIKSGAGDIDVGQLVYFDTPGEIRQILTAPGGTCTIWPPLSATPSEDDDFKAGINFMLSSDDHPSYTFFAHYDGPHRFQLAGTKTVKCEITMEVGKTVPMVFTLQGLTPTFDHTAQGTTPTLDTDTVPPRCMGMTMFTEFSAVASGVPTQTETIITGAAYIDVAVNDKIRIDVGSGVWETVNITNVSGNAGESITLTHASVSVAASADDTVYIVRNRCANTGDSIGITIELESVFENCFESEAGKASQEFTRRQITLAKTPYFKGWQEIFLRDNVVASSLLITLGNTENNIIAFYIPAQCINEASVQTEDLMKVNTTSQAYRHETLENDHEFVMAVF